jgi:hypothetical protein
MKRSDPWPRHSSIWASRGKPNFDVKKVVLFSQIILPFLFSGRYAMMHLRHCSLFKLTIVMKMTEKQDVIIKY